MNETMILFAGNWAELHHKGQVRKYTGEAYITHPKAVAGLVRSHGLSDTAVMAALLHDVVEDTAAVLEDVEGLFGAKVAKYVWFLTKTPECVGNRSERKELDRMRLSMAPEEVRIIKFFDVYHNASSIEKYDPDFWKEWRYESMMLMLALDVESIESLSPYNDFIGSL